jgi:hypothetical protein
MREKRRLLKFLIVIGLLSALAVAYAQFFHKPPSDDSSAGNAKPLTLRAAATQLRVELADETRLEYGELVTLSDDWAVAARFTFSVDQLPQFLTKNGLRPVDGLRVVPTHSGPVDRSAIVAPTGSAAPSPLDAEDPEIMSPTPLGSVLTDDSGWLPERAGKVSGVDRSVKEGVARWFLFDLDDTATVTMYVYATAEERLLNPAPSKTGPSGSKSPSPTGSR